MFRWRCVRRSCGRDTYGSPRSHRRKSTKLKVAPKCPGCGHEMRLDRRRTSGAEKRKHNCHCGVPRFAPHQHNYCKRLEIRQYEESVANDTSVAEVPF